MTHARIRTSQGLREEEEKQAKELQLDITQKLEETARLKQQDVELKQELIKLNEDISNIEAN
jgi:hypothetical protein